MPTYFLYRNTPEKLQFWQNSLKELEQRLKEAEGRFRHVRIGDWYQNAEYEDAYRNVEVIKTRIKDIKKIINQLKSQP